MSGPDEAQHSVDFSPSPLLYSPCLESLCLHQMSYKPNPYTWLRPWLLTTWNVLPAHGGEYETSTCRVSRWDTGLPRRHHHAVSLFKARFLNICSTAAMSFEEAPGVCLYG